MGSLQDISLRCAARNVGSAFAVMCHMLAPYRLLRRPRYEEGVRQDDVVAPRRAEEVSSWVGLYPVQKEWENDD